MSLFCLFFVEGCKYCKQDPAKEKFTLHQISRSHRRTAQRFCNIWLASSSFKFFSRSPSTSSCTLFLVLLRPFYPFLALSYSFELFFAFFSSLPHNRFRNTWLILSQLSWLLLTDLPAKLTDSEAFCQLCGACTHLFWMLFWFSTGKILQHPVVLLSKNQTTGVEGIFLVFAMNNVVSIPIHTLLLSAGTLLPVISVVCILAFSISSDEQVT